MKPAPTSEDILSIKRLYLQAFAPSSPPCPSVSTKPIIRIVWPTEPLMEKHMVKGEGSHNRFPAGIVSGSCFLMCHKLGPVPKLLHSLHAVKGAEWAHLRARSASFAQVFHEINGCFSSSQSRLWYFMFKRPITCKPTP